MFYEHELTGHPVMRPMLANYPNDPHMFKIDTQYMLSDKLLVSPVLEPNSNWVVVRFPSTDGDKEGDIWYDIYDNYKKYEAVGGQAINAEGDKVPVFQRGGTIIPTKMKPQKASYYMRDDPLTIYVAVDKNQEATGNVYIDDETSYKYRSGSFKLIEFAFKNATLDVSENDSKDFKPKISRVYFAGLKAFNKAEKSCTVNGNKQSKGFSIEKVEDEYFYVDIDESLAECEMSWTLTLTNGAITSMSRGLLMSIIVVNVIKKLLF